MIKKQFKNKNNQTIKHAILAFYPQISERKASLMIKNKDVKINGQRISTNVEIFLGDTVEFFIDEKSLTLEVEIFFKDEKVLIVNKPTKLETTSLNKEVETLETIIRKTYPTAKALHRLDTNTSGLVIFSLNSIAYFELLSAFKNGEIEKYYKAVVFSKNMKESDVFQDYLLKNSETSTVLVAEAATENARTANLEYKTLCKKGNLAVVEIKLITGRTHQIRAQLAKHNIFVVGDGKYGDKTINRKYKQSYQNLCAFKIIFNINKKIYLAYLNNLSFNIDCNFDYFDKL